MANIAAIPSVGTSLATYLTRAYIPAVFPEDVTKPSCTFEQLSIGGLRNENVDVPGDSVRVLIFLYRVSMNEHMRTSGRPTDPDMNPAPLSVDLHYLVTFWAGSAENEQLLLAWTLRQMHETPVLDGSILSDEAGWAPDDVIHLIPEEISNEDLMRIWDTVEPNYRLSLSYIARIVRIDPTETRDHLRVAATRFNYGVPSSSP